MGMRRSILIVFFLIFIVCKTNQTLKEKNIQETELRNSEKAYLGILYVETPSGIQIAEVFPDSPASKSGLEPGDIILSANGYPVLGSYTLKENIFALKPGTEVIIEVMKITGKKTILKAILEPIPEKYKNQYLNQLK